MDEPETMSIDIDSLSREELQNLLDRIVKRINYLDRLNAQAKLQTFEVGDQVRMDYKDQTTEGVLAGIKKKSVTMLAEGKRQDVHPWLLTKNRMR